MIKLVFALGAAAIVGTGFYLKNPYRAPNIYDMTPAQAYAKLRARDVAPSGSGPYGTLDTVTTGMPDERVTWTSTGSHARFVCHAYITPEGTAQSRLEASCENGGSPSDGAAQGLVAAMNWKATIELIDSTLEDRPYDVEGGKGKTAWNWPADRVEHGDLNDAIDGAHEMHAELLADLEKQGVDVEAAARRARDEAKAGEHEAEMRRMRAQLNQ